MCLFVVVVVYVRYLRYSLEGSDVFGVESETGEVLLVSPLDYETTQEYILTLTATDRAVPPLTTSVILNITVTDYNDNSPVFVDATLMGVYICLLLLLLLFMHIS